MKDEEKLSEGIVGNANVCRTQNKKLEILLSSLDEDETTDRCIFFLSLRNTDPCSNVP